METSHRSRRLLPGAVVLCSLGLLMPWVAASPSGANVPMLASYVPPAGSHNGSATVTATSALSGVFGTLSQTCASVVTCVAEENNTGRIPAFSNVTSAAQDSYGNYFSFTITPPAGQQITLSSLVYYGRSYISTTQTGIAVRTSLDGFAADVSGSASTATVTSGGLSTLSSTLSSLAPITSATTIRIYVWGNQAGDWVDLMGVAQAAPTGIEIDGAATPLAATTTSTTSTAPVATTSAATLSSTGSNVAVLGATGIISLALGTLALVFHRRRARHA